MSSTIRVLVVDDDPGARALHGRSITETPGYSLAGAVGTGQSALERSAHDIDLVLLDMRLPDISGVEVLHRLRGLGPNGPDVLVVSSSRDQVTVRQALAAHVIGYLVKPFDQDVLRGRLDDYRSRHRERAQHERDLPLAQGEIDRLHAVGTTRVPRAGAPLPSGALAGTAQMPARLPKGLAEVTLARVIAALDPVAPATVADVSAVCSISRATTRRYLDHLVRAGVIDLAHRYGVRGRPQILYRLAPAPEAALTGGNDTSGDQVLEG